MLSVSRWMESSDHASSSVSLLVCDIASIILDLGLGDRFDGLAQLVNLARPDALADAGKDGKQAQFKRRAVLNAPHFDAAN